MMVKQVVNGVFGIQGPDVVVQFTGATKVLQSIGMDFDGWFIFVRVPQTLIGSSSLRSSLFHLDGERNCFLCVRLHHLG